MTERVIELPDGQLRRALSDYIASNPQATAQLSGFLEGQGVTEGACRLEVTRARIVVTLPDEAPTASARRSRRR